MSSGRSLLSIVRGLTIAALLASLLAPPAATAAATPRTSLPDVEDEVMCTICGTLLELSEAPQADRQRALIQRLIDGGMSKEEIKDRLVAEYGSEVLATPGDEGFDLVAWVVPILAIALAAGGIGFFALRRLRQPSTPTAAPSIDAPDASRLDEDMSRYDL
jgi:cytochrome c-type biogenesis protein CcmH/NrfF